MRENDFQKGMSALNDHTELELLRRVATGDEAAFRHLFYAHKAKLFSFVYDLSRSEEKAEDIVQDVFLKIWQGREKLAGVTHFSAYLLRVAQNHAIDQLRRLARESKFLSSLPTGEMTSSSDPEEALLFKETQKIYQKALDSLPPQQRKIYLLHREKGMKHDEIARELNLSVSTVQNHMFRALENLRNFLSGNYPEASLYLLIVAGTALH